MHARFCFPAHGQPPASWQMTTLSLFPCHSRLNICGHSRKKMRIARVKHADFKESIVIVITSEAVQRKAVNRRSETWRETNFTSGSSACRSQLNGKYFNETSCFLEKQMFCNNTKMNFTLFDSNWIYIMSISPFGNIKLVPNLSVWLRADLSHLVHSLEWISNPKRKRKTWSVCLFRRTYLFHLPSLFFFLLKETLTLFHSNDSSVGG